MLAHPSLKLMGCCSTLPSAHELASEQSLQATAGQSPSFDNHLGACRHHRVKEPVEDCQLWCR
jgi:hypothetical protein